MKLVRTNKNERRERGFTLLEYCAGAAIIAGVLWGTLTMFGTSLTGMMTSVSDWASTVRAPSGSTPSTGK